MSALRLLKKNFCFPVLFKLLLGGWITFGWILGEMEAQANVANSLSTTKVKPTPARVEQLKKRFREGVGFVKKENYKKALSIFGKILQEDPEARGSLLMSGVSCNRLFRFAEAKNYFERFLALEPDHVPGVIGIIKSYQALNEEKKVEKYRNKLLQLRRQRINSKLNQMLSYEREIIPAKGKRGERRRGFISIQEYFRDSSQSPVWSFVWIENKKVKKRLELTKGTPEQKRALEQANPGLKIPALYILGEVKDTAESTTGYKIHAIFQNEPRYEKTKQRALQLFGSN